MFTWICPKCGSEVPPSENECPNCRARANATQPALSGQSPTVERSAPTEPVIAPPPPRYEVPTAPAVRQASTISPALVALCSAVGIVALLAVLYLFVLPRRSARTSSVAMENAAVPGTAAAPAHPLAKYIEVTGLRVMEGRAGQAKIAFVAVNHSPADLPDLSAQLTLAGGGKEMFDFPVKIPSMGPYETKDITTAVKTNLKPYELPDWQTLRPTLRIISEQ